MCNKTRVSVLVPTISYLRLQRLLSSLLKQTVKPYEIIIVYKGNHLNRIEKVCSKYSSLPCVIINQTKGYFTHALNLCKREACGSICIFTDDDAIAPSGWVKKYLKYHKIYGKNIACISSRDLYLDLKSMKIIPTPDDALRVKLFRWFIRPWLERPYPLLIKYKLGVYLTKNLKVAHGPYIPSKPCFSLPFRGVNMSFKKEALDEVAFPEHPSLKRALGNEQHVGLQLIMKGYQSIYLPDNPVLHEYHASLSRTNYKEIKMELDIMRSLYFRLINDYAKLK